MTTSSLSMPTDGSASARAAAIVGRLVDQVGDIDSEIARLNARKVWLLDQARVWSQASIDTVVPESAVTPSFTAAKRFELSRRSLTAEIACGTRIPEATASRLLDESETLVHELPLTRAALADGSISYRHAQIMCEQARSLPAHSRAAFEEAVLPAAFTTTAARFARRARDVREHVHPESIRQRAVAASADRHVSFEPDRDGMAWLHHYLPAVDAVRIDDTLEQLARELARDGASASTAATEDAAASDTASETRTHAQLRSDVLRDLLLSDPVTGRPQSLRPTVIVTVPVLTLLGHDDTPASLDGYGPIDAETARELCAHAPSFMRILTHPESGAILSVGRDHYRPPADLTMALRIADETCRFPGCARRARRCEIDHTHPWQAGGETTHTNLAHLCPKHHHLKHETAWRVTIDHDRALHWHSPGGARHSTHPAALAHSNASPPLKPAGFDMADDAAPF